jgi:hypothetical protein
MRGCHRHPDQAWKEATLTTKRKTKRETKRTRKKMRKTKKTHSGLAPLAVAPNHRGHQLGVWRRPHCRQERC